MKRKITAILFIAVFVVLTFVAMAHAQVGDGIIDDTAALQAKLDKLAAGGVLKLTSGKTYRITDNLFRSSAIVLESTVRGKPATLFFDYDAVKTRPWGRTHLTLQPKLGASVEWNEKLSAGIRPAATQPAKGQSYLVTYGADPFDPSPVSFHFRGFSDGGGLPAPTRDINGNDHSYASLLSSIDGSIVQDIRFTHSEGNGIDVALAVYFGRGITLHNLSGTFTTAILFDTCESCSVSGLRGVMLPKSHSSSGRAIGAGMSRGISINDVDIEAGDGAAVFMSENWCEGFIYSNIRVHLRPDGLPSSGWSPIWFGNGGTTSTAVLNARIDTEKVKGLYLWDCGGEPNQEPPRFGTILHTGIPFAISNVAILNLIKVPVSANLKAT